jgi:hypothetical protein
MIKQIQSNPSQPSWKKVQGRKILLASTTNETKMKQNEILK